MNPAKPSWSFVSHTALRSRWMLGAVLSSLWLSACQSVPNAAPTPAIKATTPTASVSTQSGVRSSTATDDARFQPKPYIPTIEEQRQQAVTRDRQNATPKDETSYDSRYSEPAFDTPPEVIIEPTPEIIIVPLPNAPTVVTPPQPPSHQALLEQARQHSARPNTSSASSSDNLPAFRNLMQVGVAHLSRGELTAAENSFTRAQRLAPRSSAVYFYLSQIAIKKNQPHKAEALARRGLSVSEDTTRRRALWQLIQQAGQMQNNARVVQEAKQALR